MQIMKLRAMNGLGYDTIGIDAVHPKQIQWNRAQFHNHGSLEMLPKALNCLDGPIIAVGWLRKLDSSARRNLVWD